MFKKFDSQELGFLIIVLVPFVLGTILLLTNNYLQYNLKLKAIEHGCVDTPSGLTNLRK